MATALGPPVYALSRAGLGMMARHYGGLALKRGAYALSAGMGARAMRNAWTVRKRFRSSGRSSGRFQGNVTFQHDSRSIYRRRRAPRRVRRRAIKFSKRVGSVINKSLGQQTAIRNYSNSVTVTPTAYFDGQDVNEVMLYSASDQGSDPTIESSMRVGDLNYINTLVNAGAATSNKVRFKSAVLDMTFTNTGTNAIILNIYEVYARTDCEGSPNIQWLKGLNKETGGSGVDLGYYGITPFDAPYFGKFFTITRKRRVFLNPGTTNTFQIRFPKDINLDLDRFDVGSSPKNYSAKGKTRGLMWTVYSNQFVLNSGGTAYIPAPFTYQWGFTKTYHYCEEQFESDKINEQAG